MYGTTYMVDTKKILILSTLSKLKRDFFIKISMYGLTYMPSWKKF